MPAGGVVDLSRAWWYMAGYVDGWLELSVTFLLLVIAVTSVRVVRVAWWAFRTAPSTPGRPRDGADGARLSARAMLVARSTRGLARATVWLTCAGVAVDLKRALIMIGDGSDPPLSILILQHLAVLEASAIKLGLCALLFAATLAFDLVAARMGRQSPFPPVPSALEVGGAGDTYLRVLLRRSHLAVGLIALVLISHLLFDLRPTYVAVAARRDPFFVSAVDDVLEPLWSRLSPILGTVGVLTWLTTLLESAMLRRRLPE
jgi:hypothetical protein